MFWERAAAMVMKTKASVYRESKIKFQSRFKRTTIRYDKASDACSLVLREFEETGREMRVERGADFASAVLVS